MERSSGFSALRSPEQQRHLGRRYDEVEGIRKFLYNPHLEPEPYIGTGQPLLVNGKDWALQPSMWFSLTTPSFDDEDLWGPLFPSLKQHMKDSPFWQHLADLVISPGRI